MKLENASTIEKPDLRKKIQENRKKKSKNVRIYSSFLTVILFLCIVQLSWSALLNISKIVMYQGKIYKSNILKTQAQERKKLLINNTRKTGSLEQVESIARNNLKMAGNDEVLVLINQNAEDETQEPKTLKEKFLKFMKSFE